MKIPFNQPHFTGREGKYLEQAARTGKVSGNGLYTQKCHRFFEKRYHFKKVLLTTSCTDALEMAALLADIQPGDEVIVPAYTFVSTANAFALRGAKIVFADSLPQHPNLDVSQLESLIGPKTKAIVVMHYGGVAVDMDPVMELAKEHQLLVIEDAAQAIDATYKGIPLGSIGHIGTFSFHETKNIMAGEGGMITINDERFLKRAEIIWEKGTNRAAFARGEVQKYEWVDLGSSYLPSELTAALLYSQVEQLDNIQEKRRNIWQQYAEKLQPLKEAGHIDFLELPDFASQNGHLFYITTKDRQQRNALLDYLNKKGIQAVFHYLPLHQSPYFKKRHNSRKLPHAVHFADTLVRLPLFYQLSETQITFIAKEVMSFFAG